MTSINKLLLENKACGEKKAYDPEYFKRLSRSKPGVFMDRPSDSRVPGERDHRHSAGEIFVHRNIANW
jgi:carbonic anhydrase